MITVRPDRRGYWRFGGDVCLTPPRPLAATQILSYLPWWGRAAANEDAL